MRVERLLGHLLVVLLELAGVCAPIARAGGQVEVGGVKIVVRTPWPEMLDHGALPLLIDVTNNTQEDRAVQLVFSSNMSMRGARIEKSLVLSTFERQSFEIFAPVSSFTSSDYVLDARAGGERDYLRGLGASSQPEAGVRNVLVLSQDWPDAGAAGTWSAALSTEAKPRWSSPPVSSPMIMYGHVRPPTTPTQCVLVKPILFADLPRRTEPYSSIDAVVIDPHGGAPPPEEMAAIVAYARTGGVVALFGRSAVRIARSTAELEPWMEERFHVGTEHGVDTWLCGQGLLLVSESSAPLGEPQQIERLNAAMESHGEHLSWIPSPRGSRGALLAVKLPGLELPIRSMALVLILFSVLIGPVNMLLVKRWKKPALLLVTVPAIAFVFALLLFAYGALAQGLDVRAKRETFTLLDQRAHRSTSAEVREVFAGLSAGPLTPGPGASIWPEIGSGEWNEEGRYSIDATSGVVLGGDYMPVRTPVRQTLLTDRASRVRVDVRREADAYVMQNALGTGVRAFAYRAMDGSTWIANGLVADGATVNLEPGESDGPSSIVWTILAADATGEGAWLPAGCFAARLDSSAFVDQMGVEPREVGSAHCILGILDTKEAP